MNQKISTKFKARKVTDPVYPWWFQKLMEHIIIKRQDWTDDGYPSNAIDSTPVKPFDGKSESQYPFWFMTLVLIVVCGLFLFWVVR